MLNELIKNTDQSKLIGLRICTVGMLMTIAGFLLLFLSVKLHVTVTLIVFIGKLLFFPGIVVGFVGIFIHFFVMLRIFFGKK
jgi:hypothetical protein